MSDPVEPASPPRVGLWATISGLLVFGLTLPFWGTVGKMRTVYDQLGIEESAIVDLLAFLIWIPFLGAWLLALNAARKDRAEAVIWFRRTAVAITLVQLAVFIALWYPILTKPA